jgi:predicted DNA binding protein
MPRAPTAAVSIFAEFAVGSEDFALGQTLETEPETLIEIDRVAATEKILTPYFWVSDVGLEAFESAAADDPSVEDLRRLDEFESASLYRATWTQNVETIVYAYTRIEATILEASGRAGEWRIRMRFDGRGPLESFQDFTQERDISYSLSQLHELEHARSGTQYGLTKKQHEALETAWEMGYFATPRETKMADVAAELGVTRQSLSERLRRGERTLVANTLAVTTREAESG